METVINLAPQQYAWVEDLNTSVTRLITGPTRYTRKDNEVYRRGPTKMLNLPPESYVEIENPVMRDDTEGKPLYNEFEQVKLKLGDVEIRCSREWMDPFPLYPGEVLKEDIKALTVVEKNHALLLRAVRSFDEVLDVVDDDSTDYGVEQKTSTIKHRQAGDEWLFQGPSTYIPRAEVTVIKEVSAIVIHPNRAVRLRAKRKTKDAKGTERKAGEEWLVRESGAYLPSADEEVIVIEKAKVITDKIALHVSASHSYTDIYGTKRKAGDEWLVTSSDSDNHIRDVHEEIIGFVQLKTLTNREYCVVVNPWIDGKQLLGTRHLRKGECSFFLQPGEILENGIQNIEILQDDEAILLQANEDFVEIYQGEETHRIAGDRWLICGPCEYIPSLEASVVDRRKAVPLDTNEGIYVRDNKSGTVRSVTGSTYLLNANEELWMKELPKEIEKLLIKQKLGQGYIVLPDGKTADKGISSSSVQQWKRDRTKVVKFRVPHNCAMQVYDYKKKTSRILIGPDMVMLEPDEMFSVLRLSGDKPKRPNMIKSLVLQLGPDFMTDIVTVETSDHARLQLTLSYNWHFDISKEENIQRIFNVRDFTGTACKALASRVRGACAAITFDSFHKNSAKVIRSSIFGVDKETGKIKDSLYFVQNALKITNVDIQSVEPVDCETRKSLQKSVQMAITITTNSQEAAARHQAMAEEEEAKGRLEQQRLQNKSEAEKRKKQLLELQALSNAVQTSGQAKAEAQALAEAEQIRTNAKLEQAKLLAEAERIRANEELRILREKNLAVIEHQKALNILKIEKAEALAKIESQKFKEIIDAIGTETIADIARAGPEMQVKLLQSLGIKSTLITDGKKPINLFQTAQSLIGMGTEDMSPSSS